MNKYLKSQTNKQISFYLNPCFRSTSRQTQNKKIPQNQNIKFVSTNRFDDITDIKSTSNPVIF
jgi:hypothetical protein